jgi:uncharacterized protein (TIGR00251 family)
MESWLKKHNLGSLIRIYVQPGASKTELVGSHGDRLKIKIKAPPQDGEANQALSDYFSEIFNIPNSRIYLLRGQSSRRKDVLVELSIEKVTILLKELLK